MTSQFRNTWLKQRWSISAKIIISHSESDFVQYIIIEDRGQLVIQPQKEFEISAKI